MNYVVVDTEGKELLSEIAIVDAHGDLLLELFVEDNLQEVLNEVKEILESHLVVAHYAEHDLRLLKKSFASVGQEIDIQIACSYKKAKELLNDMESYSLEFLSKALFLQHQSKFFDQNLAHRASYDALFTYELYKKLLEIEDTYRIAKTVNPFSSSKVDNPFQDHYDDTALYAGEFDTLLKSVDEIKNDPNHQTKSAVVLAEAGNGKTHLMMRFVQSVSQTNRFLFIGKPNDKHNILLHIYMKILESFIQKIDDSPYSQLEYLLAKSFSRIIVQNGANEKIKDVLSENPLNIYTHFGKDGTVGRQKNWKYIEKVMLKWYRGSYGNELVSIEILKALIKYTLYADEHRRDIVINYLSGKELPDDLLKQVGLDRLDEDFNKEVFSLAAISLFGKLSIFDEPLIISFDQLEAMSGDDELVEHFAQNIKELITVTPNAFVMLNLFPHRWREYEAIFDGSIIDLLGRTKVYLERPNSLEMRRMLQRRASQHGINLDAIFSSPFIYKEILQYDSIRKVLNRANDYYNSIIHQAVLPNLTELSLEERVKQLTMRVEYLESLHQVKQPRADKKIDFDIQQYIQKVYEQKSLEYQKRSIVDDKSDNDKLKFILRSIDTIYPFDLDFFKMRKVIPEHIRIITKKHSYVVGFLHLEGRSFVNRIKNFNQLVVNNPEHQFRLFRDSRESIIRGKVSKDEILKLKNATNGDFLMMDKEYRVVYETIYQLIIDLQNKDIEIALEELMEGICTRFKDFWLCRLINPAK